MVSKIKNTDRGAWVPSPTPKFKSLLLDLQAEGKISKSLDIIYNEFENILIAGNHELCNDFIESIDDLSIFDLRILVAILIVTFQWKDELKSRDEFLNKVKAEIIKSKDTQEANSIIANIK